MNVNLQVIKKSIKLTKKFKKQYFARIYISAKLNNTIITITDVCGNTIISYSCGRSKQWKGKRSIKAISQEISEQLGLRLRNEFKTKNVKILIKGFGRGRESSILGFIQSGLKIVSIIDTTSFPHNGCKKIRARRK